MAKYLDETGLGYFWGKIKDRIDEKIGWHNNLLDNWYFIGGGSQQGGEQFPINDRGNTTYTAGSSAVGTATRWRIINNGTTFVIQSDSIKITKATSASGLCNQLLSQEYGDGTYTLSAIVKASGTCYIAFGNSGGTSLGNDYQQTVTDKSSWTLVKKTVTVSGNTTIGSVIMAAYSSGSYLEVAAVKLEKGSVSTLENDVPPNFGMEVIKCQTSKANLNDPYTNKTMATTAYVDSAITSASEIFPVTSGTTTFSAITTAFNAGKIPMIIDSSKVLPLAYIGSTYIVFSRVSYSGNFSYQETVKVTNADVWETYTYTNQLKITASGVLEGDGSGGITERAVTNNTATSSSISGSTNLITMNTLRYALNRTQSCAAANTSYTTVMARGSSLHSSASTPGVNGAICWMYK